MLKEQVAELLNWYGQANPYIDWHSEGNDGTKNYRREQAKDFLNLFKSVVDKLTVIDDEQIENSWQGIELLDDFTAIAKSQLQHTKNELDLMGE